MPGSTTCDMHGKPRLQRPSAWLMRRPVRQAVKGQRRRVRRLSLGSSASLCLLVRRSPPPPSSSGRRSQTASALRLASCSRGSPRRCPASGVSACCGIAVPHALHDAGARPQGAEAVHSPATAAAAARSTCRPVRPSTTCAPCLLCRRQHIMLASDVPRAREQPAQQAQRTAAAAPGGATAPRRGARAGDAAAAGLAQARGAAAVVQQDQLFSCLALALWCITSAKSALASPLLTHHNLQSLAGAAGSECLRCRGPRRAVAAGLRCARLSGLRRAVAPGRCLPCRACLRQDRCLRLRRGAALCSPMHRPPHARQRRRASRRLPRRAPACRSPAGGPGVADGAAAQLRALACGGAGRAALRPDGAAVQVSARRGRRCC